MKKPKETIGRCEGFCGRVDHHLINGLCPQCHNDPRVLNNKLVRKTHDAGAPLGDDMQPHIVDEKEYLDIPHFLRKQAD